MRTLLTLTALLLVGTMFFGCSKGKSDSSPMATLVLQPNLSGQTNVDIDNVLQDAKQVLERRAEVFGYEGATVQRDGDNLTVQMPDIGRDEAEKFSRTGLLEFRELQRDQNGNVAVVRDGQTTFIPLPAADGDGGPTFVIAGTPTPTPAPETEYERVLDEAVWIPAAGTGSDGEEETLTGRYLTNVYVRVDTAGQPIVLFTLNKEGSLLMQQITGRLIDAPLSFFLDGEPLRNQNGRIVAPVVKTVITDKGQIAGFSSSEWQYVTKMLKAGALPVPFDIVSYE